MSDPSTPETAGAWREIRVGLGVVVVLAVALAAFWAGRTGNPFAEQYSLVFYVEDAKGLHEGAPVRLSGLVVGQVSALELVGAAPRVRTAPAQRMGADASIGASRSSPSAAPSAAS